VPLEFGSAKNRGFNINGNMNMNMSYNYNQDKFKSNDVNNNNNYINNEEKVNYKLLKKIKKGEIDDEVEIINFYAKGNNVYLPIEEYCKY